ncbi:hypothetical protein ABT095_33460 [Kitasatospora sp. NPDC002227]|uniref:hypothetical protein n=1 Tax=Kitasatospora sp. NPDC002227 TaxID=3154773 RepID=UPI0033244FB6
MTRAATKTAAIEESWEDFEESCEIALEEGYFALELELLELPAAQEVALVHTELPELGPTLLVAYVPLGPGHEAAGRRAVLAACARRLPGVFAHAVATASIPRTATGAVRAGALIDQLLPQIARDFLSPTAMSD